MADLKEAIKRFLEVPHDDGYGKGSGCGDGFGFDDGFGDGFGFGDGSGYGSGCGCGCGFSDGDGSGSDYVDGSGHGSGDGDGSGHGYGSGSGSGFSVTSFVRDAVSMVDGVPTIIDHVHGNVAKGRILMEDFTTKDCYVVKSDDAIFAHGYTLREAMDALLEKQFDDMPEEKRIEAFLEAHGEDKKYPAQDLFDWHHRLTGSCMAGRKAFCMNHQIDLEHDSFTVDEFISLTKDDYGGSVIRNMAKKRRENNAQ